MSEIKPMPNPTQEQLSDPTFEAIWNVIKTWDVNVPEYYQGYCGATGSHVMLILNALKTAKAPSEAIETAVFQALGEASMCWSQRPKGIFDSTNAKRIGDELLAIISSR